MYLYYKKEECYDPKDKSDSKGGFSMMRSRMPWFALLFVFVLSTMPVAAKTFESTWKSPDAEPVDFSGKKIAALIVTKNMGARTAAEDMLANQITERGGVGIAGYTVVDQSDMQDKEKVKSVLVAAGFSGAVVMRPVLAGGQQKDPYTKDSAQYQKFMGFSDESGGDMKKKARFYVEVYVYSFLQDKLLWVGRSATKASTADELISDIAAGVAEQLNKDGLIRKK